MTDTAATPETTDTDLAPNDRRALLRKLAIGGAGAAAGAVMLSQGKVSALPAAVNGEAITAGETNLSTAPTGLVMNPAAAAGDTGPSSLSVSNAAANWATAPFPANVGGYGNNEVVHGVHGSATVAGAFGVVAANLAGPSAPAVAAPAGGLAVASANGAQIRFFPLPGAVTGPTPGLHATGELYADKDGTLWFTVPTATAGVVRFVKLAGTPAAGAFHAIDPQRSYDSRQAAYAVKGPLAPNTNRVISVADGHATDGGAVTLTNVVPAGATAVQINVTAANMTAPNFLSVTAGDKTSTNTSLLNWSPGDIQIANSITVPLDASRQIKVFCGNQTGSTDVIIDVFGYYL
jgi:hypothetical protein